MAYDEGLAQRVREMLAERAGISEKRMFGGLAFLLRGNMCVGILKDSLMVRVGSDAYPDLVRQPHAREMDFTGKPMKGFLYVDREGVEADADLSRWIGRGVACASCLPSKQAVESGESSPKPGDRIRRARRGARMR